MYIEDYEDKKANEVFKNCIININDKCNKNECGIGCRNPVKNSNKNRKKKKPGKGSGKRKKYFKGKK